MNTNILFHTSSFSPSIKISKSGQIAVGGNNICYICNPSTNFITNFDMPEEEEIIQYGTVDNSNIVFIVPPSDNKITTHTVTSMIWSNHNEIENESLLVCWNCKELVLYKERSKQTTPTQLWGISKNITKNLNEFFSEIWGDSVNEKIDTKEYIKRKYSLFIVDTHFTEKNDLVILTEKMMFFMKHPYEEIKNIELDIECKMVKSFEMNNHQFFLVGKIDGSLDLIELRNDELVLVKHQILENDFCVPLSLFLENDILYVLKSTDLIILKMNFEFNENLNENQMKSKSKKAKKQTKRRRSSKTIEMEEENEEMQNIQNENKYEFEIIDTISLGLTLSCQKYSDDVILLHDYQSNIKKFNLSTNEISTIGNNIVSFDKNSDGTIYALMPIQSLISKSVFPNHSLVIIKQEYNDEILMKDIDMIEQPLNMLWKEYKLNLTMYPVDDIELKIEALETIKQLQIDISANILCQWLSYIEKNEMKISEHIQLLINRYFAFIGDYQLPEWTLKYKQHFEFLCPFCQGKCSVKNNTILCEQNHSFVLCSVTKQPIIRMTKAWKCMKCSHCSTVPLLPHKQQVEINELLKAIDCTNTSCVYCGFVVKNLLYI